MEKIIFRFDRKWVDEAKKKYGNPVRKLERMPLAEGEGSVVKSDFASITFEVEAEKRDALAKQVGAFIRKEFEESDPWAMVEIGGNIEGMSFDPKANADADADAENESAEAVEEAASAKKQEREEAVSAEEDTAEAEKAEAKPAKAEPAEAAAAADTPAERMVEEAKQEKRTTRKKADPPAEESEQEATTDETIAGEAKRLTKELCRMIPMKYSPELAGYLNELQRVIPMLAGMNASSCLWAQNLLVSMNNGYGYSSFLEAVAKIYKCYGLLEEGDKNTWMKELMIENKASTEHKYDDWDRALRTAEGFGESNEKSRRKILLSMDISQWQSELTSAKVMDYLRKINEASTNFICVFRIPCIELPVVRDLTEQLNDVMSVRLLVVPPIAIESMVEYIKNELEKSDFSFGEDCDQQLEQWIMKEKGDNSFFGYKTLNKMISRLLYEKALVNCESGMVSRKLMKSDFDKLLDDRNLEDKPEELLNRLIGIAQVKKRIDEIVSQVLEQKNLVLQGKSVDRPCIHMMFTGNPGTGKTTVARILAKIFKEKDILRKGYFYEIKGRDLCGRYVGETAPKTSAYCRDAYGSVLFIDEAYSLYQDNMGRDYGSEAIQTLLAEMENHRDDLCVIMAGYKDEMYTMLESNPGLESRIPYEIEFPNYSRDELEQIFFRMLDGNFEYEEEVREVVRQFLASIPDAELEKKSFSNARMIRNLYERAWGKAAYRKSLTGDPQMIIRKEDVQCAFEEKEFQKLIKDRRRNRIGFAVE